jgi:SP family general alpha glucoside:H+ symporter-like MFS transporter
MDEKNVTISHVESELDRQKTTDLAEIVNLATDDDHELGIWEAIKAYKPALFWSLVMSTTVIMEGYDTNLLSNFFAYREYRALRNNYETSTLTAYKASFLIRYGNWVGVTPQTPTGYQLTAAWQSGLSQSGGAGSIVGCIISGWLVSKYGSKKTVLGALVWLSLAVFPVFFAPSLAVLIVGEVLCGLAWGILATTAPAYASEVLPTALRTYMTSYTNMCFILGQLISAGVLRGLASREDHWGYKIPFALQWVWPVFLIPLIFLAPESPWYLVRMNRMEDAEKSLRRLQSKDATHINPKNTLATIVYTNNLEINFSVGTKYLDCFKGDELRRTEIACLCFAGQILCGICFAYNSSYFFSQMGLGTNTTYSLALGGTGLAFIGCLVNWFVLMPRFGRRTIYVWGMGGMCTVLLIIGSLSAWTNRTSVATTQAVLTLAWTFMFQLSAGQLGWALPAEIGSTRLRQKTICLARDSSNIAGVIGGTLQQYMMNPQAWNLRGYTGFVWGGTCFGMFVWAFFRLPETWNRTYHELDILFAMKTPARKFATTHVDPFAHNGHTSEDEAIVEAAKEAARDAVRSGSIVLPSEKV